MAADVYLIPFVIGVTGHRDPAAGNISQLEVAVATVLADLRKQAPHTPLLLLSGLAAGADQLAARVALKQGVQVAAILPMPAEPYRATMDQQGRDGFDELLPLVALVIDLPLAAGVSLKGLTESEDQRACQYDALGHFLAKHCQAAIALWDGDKAAATGGTAAVVEMFRVAGTEVFHIPTARQRQPAQTVSLNHLQGAHASNIKARLDALNHATVARIAGADRPSDGLMPPGLGVDLPEFEQRVAQAFWTADESAIRFGGSTRKTLFSLLALAFLAVASFEIYAHLFNESHILWFIYPAALAAAWCISRLAHKRDVEALYLEHRSLAEALRTQFFWSLAGVERSAADAYLDHQCEWVRTVLRNIWLYRSRGHGPVPGGFDLSLRYWVQDQHDWFEKKAGQQKGAQERVEKISDLLLKALFGFSIVAPACLLYLHEVQPATHGLLILTVTLPSVLVGLQRLWVEKQGYEEQARAYHRMADVFRTHPGGKEDLERLGLNVLEENSEWLLLHRERPLHVVAGG